MAGDALKIVKAPTLLLVGGQDFGVIELNQKAQGLLANCKLSIVPEATHLFEEPGTLEEVSKQAAQWYDAFVFADRTHALKSLHAVFVHGEFPETWPTGQ